MDLVRTQIGAIASLNKVYLVKRLPKTRSGKILRKVIRQIANQESFTIPATIDDPTCIGEFVKLLA